LLQTDGVMATPLLRSFGDYELIEQVGHGGMGVIFKARQRSLDRIVALKLIRAGPLAKPDDIARFRTEAAAAGRLQHPHIVAIHEVGEHEGQYFYSMEFVPGHSLARELQAGPLAPREAARLLLAIAEAIHFAHEKGVLHRDLKPSNILLDAEREPRVADFGLAKILQSDSELTVSGAVIGSPQYMPPEQASGKSARAGPASDVYSLGAILYESLTGRPPFNAATPLETMKLVVEQEPISPRALNPALPLDLETLCLRCLAKEPGARYASAQELADELGRFLRDEPIHARPITPVERAWRWCKRKPALASLGAVLLIAPAVISLVLLVMGNRVASQRNQSVAQLYAADVALAARALQDQDYGIAWRSLAAHLPATERPSSPAPALGFEWRWLWQKAQGQADKTIAARPTWVHAIAYSPDGRLLASATSDGTTKLWDTASARLVRTLASPDGPRSFPAYVDRSGISEVSVLSASFVANGRGLLTTGKQGLILWDVETGEQRWQLLTNGLNIGLCSPVDTNLALAILSYPRTNLALVDLSAGRPSRFLSEGRSDAICFSPGGRYFARWDRDTRRVWLHTCPAGLPTASFDDGRAYIIAMAITPDDRTLALANMMKGSVDLFDMATQRLVGRLSGRAGRLRTLAISPDGHWLASAAYDHAIHLWDLPARSELRQLQGHRGVVQALAFSPDSQRLASGSDDGTVRFWEVVPAPPPPPITNVFGAFVFSPDGGQLLTRDATGAVRLWHLPERRLLHEWTAPPFQTAVFTSAELILACPNASNEPVCLRFPLASNPPVRARSDTQPPGGIPGGSRAIRLQGVSSPCSAIGLSPDGAIAVTGHQDGTVALWDADSGRLRHKAERQFLRDNKLIEVKSLAISTQGELLAAVSFEPVMLRTWYLGSGQLRGRRDFAGAYAMPLAISPDGRRLATGRNGEGLSVNLWEPQLRERKMELLGHRDVPMSLAFSPDGRTLATSGADGLVKLWHLPTQREVLTILTLEHGVWVDYLNFSPDGTWLGAADTQGVLHLFHAPVP
jgi:WD40 repeat protein